ncbi:MAG: type II 3-dehydroquinate dehydratase [Clostridiales bacterium]|nr:type II 3-dehydroquinate dehydratase [Clostridiales bacterium]
MHILVLNGPNLNLLGIREPRLYGRATYEELCGRIGARAKALGVQVSFFQSNHEGDLVDAIQQAYGKMDAIIINPGAYTHTSIAILDALKAVGIRAVEVHLTDVDAREDFRKISYVRLACEKTISGHGCDGYLEALDYLAGGGACGQ